MRKKDGETRGQGDAGTSRHRVPVSPCHLFFILSTLILI